MTYLVLARKWRPRSFDTLVGQDHVVRALTHALDTQRLHHAWLFTGTRGVGKTTLSRILAKSLNCEKGITAQPCGQCRACVEIDAGRFVDYVELDAASNRGVDEMTQLLEQAVYAPSSARFKVYMIDEVHMLTGHAFNAMLKTLEEPPAHVKFILATTDPQKIPVTVLSRCLQFNLKHMTVESIVTHLDIVLRDEQLEFEVPALRLLAQAAGGSMRDALSLTDQAIAYSAGNLTLEAVRGMLGTIDQRHLLRLLQGLGQGSAQDVLAVADELASRGLSYSGALADLAVLLSHVAIHQRVPGALPSDDPQAEDIAALAATLHPDLVQLYYSIAVHSRSELSLAPDEYAGFVMACLRMLALTPEASTTPPSPPTSTPTPTPPSRERLSSEQATTTTASAPAAIAPLQSQTITSVRSVSAEPVPEPPQEAVRKNLAPDQLHGGVRKAPESLASDSASVVKSPEPEVHHSAPVKNRASDPQVDEGPDIPAWEALPQQEVVPDTQAEAVAVEVPTAEAEDVAPPAMGPVSVPEAGVESGRVSEHDAVAHEAPPYDMGSVDDGDWEPVMDDGEFESEPLGAMPDVTGDGAFESGALAALAPKQPSASTRAPRIARMTAQEWPGLAAALPLTGLADELARESEWVGVEGDTVILRVAIHSLAAKQGLARLRTVLTEHFGKVVQVRIQFGVTGDSTARAVETKWRAQRQQQAEEAVASDPFILGLIEEFGAQVIPGSITALDDKRVA